MSPRVERAEELIKLCSDHNKKIARLYRIASDLVARPETLSKGLDGLLCVATEAGNNSDAFRGFRLYKEKIQDAESTGDHETALRMRMRYIESPKNGSGHSEQWTKDIAQGLFGNIDNLLNGDHDSTVPDVLKKEPLLFLDAFVQAYDNDPARDDKNYKRYGEILFKVLPLVAEIDKDKAQEVFNCSILRTIAKRAAKEDRGTILETIKEIPVKCGLTPCPYEKELTQPAGSNPAKYNR